jgi:hypothetical protein
MQYSYNIVNRINFVLHDVQASQVSLYELAKWLSCWPELYIILEA